MRALVILPFLLFSSVIFAQTCNLTISGNLTNKSDKSELAFATVYVEETEQGNVATASGFFILKNLCPGKYHLRISHINSETKTIEIDLKKSIVVNVSLSQNTELLNEVVIKGGHTDESLVNTKNSIDSEQIDDDNGKALSDMIANISGVSTIKNGAGVSKPVIHGLSGNRVAILNNGIVQAGQQWGNDHAPEIDPNAVNQISVIKGVGAIEYGGNALGGVVLVEPGVIPKSARLNGSLNYVFEKNGRGHSVATKLQNSGKLFNWRLTGTVKKFGDRETPDYFLRNTGNTEANMALQLNKSITDDWSFDFYYSLFNAKIGILRGSHIGNSTDLEAAIGKDVPFYTEPDFSYNIAAPKQKVQHHLLKLNSKYFLDSNTYFSVTYAGQLNDRKEFDVRRGERSDKPALSLSLLSHILDLKYHATRTDYSLKFGIQGKINDNTNDPETGILPLLPDYDLYNIGAFSIFQKNFGDISFEAGARYDYINLKVATITRSVPRTIKRYNHNFQNYSFDTGLNYDNSNNFISKFNIGITQRSPEVNELHSYGLHQGVSGVEIGNPDLKPEQSIKAIWTNTLSINNKLSVEGSVYYQSFNDFIYLELQQEFELTIRGAFLKYEYKQTDASIRGADLIVNYEPTEQIEFQGKYSLIRGRDRSNSSPLVFMPTDNVFSSLSYSLKNGSRLHDTKFSVNGKYNFRQTNFIEIQDVLSPPDSYFLLGASVETKLKFNKSSVRLLLQVENILNTTYRDYLNRLRYYADEMGRNFRVGLKFSF